MLRTCPYCFEKWASTEAKLASTIIWTGVIYQFNQFGISARILHCVISFELDQDDPAAEDISELRERARRIGRKHGLVGSMKIIHPSRDYDSDGFHLEINESKPGKVYRHFHMIAVATGNVWPGSSEEYRQGIIFKVVPDPRYHDFRGFRRLRELRACIRYLLTHCGIIEGRHSVTYDGCLGYNKKTGLDREELKDKYPEAFKALEPRKRTCPKCGSDQIEKSFQWERGELIQVHPLPDDPPPTETREMRGNRLCADWIREHPTPRMYDYE